METYCQDVWDVCLSSMIPVISMAVDLHDEWVLQLRCGVVCRA